MKRHSIPLYIAATLLLWSVSIIAKAQCTFDLDVQVLQNSYCASNGIIQVELKGEEIDLSNVLISLNGAGGTINELSSNSKELFLALPPGEYSITAHAVCKETTKEVTQTTKATVASEYDALNAIVGTQKRKSLICSPTGLATIEMWDGRPPYKVEITSMPTEYQGETVFTRATSGTLVVEHLAPGNYTFTVSDDCLYSIPLPVTVGVNTADFPSDPYPNQANIQNCRQVYVYPNHEYDADLGYYWNNHRAEYYEVAFVVDGGAKNWETPQSQSTYYYPQYINLPEPYRAMYNAGKNIEVYMRIKGDNCVEQLVDVISLPQPSNSVYNSAYKNCDSFDWTFSLYNETSYCPPFKWEVFDNESTLVNSAENITNFGTQRASGLSYDKDYTVVITDSNGEQATATTRQTGVTPYLYHHSYSRQCSNYSVYYIVYDICFPYTWEAWEIDAANDSTLVQSNNNVNSNSATISGLEYNKNYLIKIYDNSGHEFKLNYNVTPPDRYLSVSVSTYRCEDYDIQ